MSLIQDLDDNVYLVHLSVVTQLLSHTAKDLGESSLAQTLILKKQTKQKLMFYYVENLLGKEVCIFPDVTLKP